MRIQPFAEGPYGTSCYTVYEYSGNECVIIDAPFPFRGPASFIEENDLVPAAIYLTHGHFDHIFGLVEARRIWPGIPIFIVRMGILIIYSALWKQEGYGLEYPFS